MDELFVGKIAVNLNRDQHETLVFNARQTEAIVPSVALIKNCLEVLGLWNAQN